MNYLSLEAKCKVISYMSHDDSGTGCDVTAHFTSLNA
jgi:hypothetical protein